MSVYNLDIILLRLRNEKGWSTKKEERFIRRLEKKKLIKRGQRPGSRVVENLDKHIQEFESPKKKNRTPK